MFFSGRKVSLLSVRFAGGALVCCLEALLVLQMPKCNIH